MVDLFHLVLEVVLAGDLGWLVEPVQAKDLVAAQTKVHF